MPDFPAWPIHENGRGIEPLPIATRRGPGGRRIGLGTKSAKPTTMRGDNEHHSRRFDQAATGTRKAEVPLAV